MPKYGRYHLEIAPSGDALRDWMRHNCDVCARVQEATCPVYVRLVNQAGYRHPPVLDAGGAAFMGGAARPGGACPSRVTRAGATSGG